MRNWRKIIAALLVFVIVFASAGVLYADESEDEGRKSSGGILNNSSYQEYHEKNEPGYMERAIAGILISPVKFIMNLFNISDPVLLVFGKDPRADTSDSFLTEGIYGSASRDDLVLGTFPQAFFKGISVLYTAFEKLLPIPLVIAVVIVSMMLMLNSGSSEGRNKQKEYVRAFVVAIVALRFGAYFWHWLFSINHFLIDWIWGHMMGAGIVPGFFMDMVWGTGRSSFEDTVNMGSFPMAIILLLAVGMVFTLNFQYTMRMIILGVLIIIFPIVVTLSVFPSFRHSLKTWVQEFVANTIVQLAHAIALGGFFITLSTPGVGEGGSFWIMIAYFFGMSTIVNLVRQMVGLQGGGSAMGMMSGAMGLMAMMNMGRMLKSSSPNASSGGDGGATSGDAGGDTTPSGGSVGGTSHVGTGFKGLAGAALGGMKNFAMQAAPKAAKMGIAGAAAMTGAVVSTMATGNPALGMVAGAGAGKMLANGAATAAGGAMSFAQNMPAIKSHLSSYFDKPPIDYTHYHHGNTGYSSSGGTSGGDSKDWGFHQAQQTVSAYSSPTGNQGKSYSGLSAEAQGYSQPKAQPVSYSQQPTAGRSGTNASVSSSSSSQQTSYQSPTGNAGKSYSNLSAEAQGIKHHQPKQSMSYTQQVDRLKQDNSAYSARRGQI